MDQSQWLFAAFAALQAADVWSTREVLSRGGRELNPLMARLFARFGFWPSVLLAKGAAVLLVWLCLEEMAVWELAAVDLAYVLVLGNNLLAIGRMSRRMGRRG